METTENIAIQKKDLKRFYIKCFIITAIISIILTVIGVVVRYAILQSIWNNNGFDNSDNNKSNSNTNINRRPDVDVTKLYSTTGKDNSLKCPKGPEGSGQLLFSGYCYVTNLSQYSDISQLPSYYYYYDTSACKNNAMVVFYQDTKCPGMENTFSANVDNTCSYLELNSTSYDSVCITCDSDKVDRCDFFKT